MALNEQSAENGVAADEPRQHYVNDDTGECWAQGCTRPATHLLVTRAKPDETFPQGLLVEAGYCFNDAVWFAGANVALHAGTFVSLVERVIPPAETEQDSDA